MFDRSTIATLASHAETSTPSAEETGILACCLVAFGVLVPQLHTPFADAAPIHSAAYGLGFADTS
jgi:hypothetical protein